ncbi:hypothetical protein GGD54_004493 [Rhizobium tropici]|uniref:Uncharacterized protein n=1 Tax=Rhizobium tropici TaxID=398 RepID=A0ABR6R4I3_RHITR|nr:hypothetical protein [Rhizobium tropici]MBB5593292.1 hypothetical protein [Rhizobium tropici]MBB6494073.1 hypothetical protein [Rhizobium tropici]
MQNEISPRRAATENAPRRGVQQAGRIGRAKGKLDRSSRGLQRHRAIDLAMRLPSTLASAQRPPLFFRDHELANAFLCLGPDSPPGTQTLDKPAVSNCEHAKAETAYAGLRHESINFFKNGRAHIGIRTRHCVHIQYTQ